MRYWRGAGQIPGWLPNDPFRFVVGAATAHVFMSYRRGDCEGHVGRLYDRLVQYFGTDRVFRDRDVIRPGADFARVIEHQVQISDVMLVIIGPQWLAASPECRLRLAAEDDWVRLEIEAAVRHGVAIIPVLFQGAQMPRDVQLPPTVRTLTIRQASEISESRWDYDTRELIRHIDNARMVKLEYEAARHSMAAGEWERALGSLSRICDIQPGYRDAERLMEHVRQEVDKTARLAPPSYAAITRAAITTAWILAAGLLLSSLVINESWRGCHPLAPLAPFGSEVVGLFLGWLYFRRRVSQGFYATRRGLRSYITRRLQDLTTGVVFFLKGVFYTVIAVLVGFVLLFPFAVLCQR